jgi:hypothetical protein
MPERQIVPARKGKAVRLARGQQLKCINTHGTQVIDMWAFNAEDMGELMSMHHTHSCLKKLMPEPGEPFYTYTRRPILTVIEDHSPGVHDTVLPACDKFRYVWDGYEGYHDSCGDNLAASLRALGLEPPRFTPQPFNLWMNNPIGQNGSIGYLPPVTKPGDYIVLKAEMDCVVSMSACPYDLANVAINGGAVRDVHFEVY